MNECLLKILNPPTTTTRGTKKENAFAFSTWWLCSSVVDAGD